MAENFMYVYAGLIVLMSGFLAYSNLKNVNEARKLYKEQDLSKFKVIDISRKWMLFYAFTFGVVVLMLVLVPQEIEVVVISIGLLIIILAELIGTYLRFKLFFNEKNFIYESKVYRIKSVRTMQTTGKWMKRSEVIMFDGTRIQMPKLFAEKISGLAKKK